MSDLAHRLLHVAATAVLPAYGNATKRKAALAVSAALKELDAEIGRLIMTGADPPDLTALADSIEKEAARG